MKPHNTLKTNFILSFHDFDEFIFIPAWFLNVIFTGCESILFVDNEKCLSDLSKPRGIQVL